MRGEPQRVPIAQPSPKKGRSLPAGRQARLFTKNSELAESRQMQGWASQPLDASCKSSPRFTASGKKKQGKNPARRKSLFQKTPSPLYSGERVGVRARWITEVLCCETFPLTPNPSPPSTGERGEGFRNKLSTQRRPVAKKEHGVSNGLHRLLLAWLWVL